MQIKMRALTSHLNVVHCATCYHISCNKVTVGWEKRVQCVCVCGKMLRKTLNRANYTICMHEKRKYI